jgi:hypothetical protein
MEFNDIMKHYSNPVVRDTIFEFCSSRWVSLEGSVESGRVFVRYVGGKPLKLDSPNALVNLIVKYRNLNVRTVYASISIYGKLGSAEDVDNPMNIVAATPFWDIDVEGLENWKLAVEIARAILDFLERSGVSKSVYLIWSGEGMHVRLHERSIPPEAYSTYSPIDVAYAIVEYVIEGTRQKIEEVVRNSRGKAKVENLIDVKRVFTAPLSLHRKHDLVAVIVRPQNLDVFDLSWANTMKFKSDDAWRYYSPGEAENLVREALKVLSSRKYRFKVRISPQERARAERDIDRFNVMALLQAARYYILTGDVEKAKSFGLNRAIFYAYLKYYGRFKAYQQKNERTEFIGGHSENLQAKLSGTRLPVEDGVEVSSRGFFVIGGKEQTPEDFERNVTRKIESLLPFDIVWEAALKYVARFPKNVLVDPQKFYKHVYEPVRDGFIKKVVEELIEPALQGETEKVKRRDINVEPIIKHSSLTKWFKKPSTQEHQQSRQDSEYKQ